MSFLRKWFHSSHREIWKQLSEQIDARFIDGGRWGGDRVEADHGEWIVTLDTYTVHANNAPITFTRLRAPYINPDHFRFTITRRNFMSDIVKWFGAQDIEIGDADFDNAFIIKGTDESKVRQLFDNKRLRHLIAGQPRIHFSVRDDEGMFGTKYPEDTDVLVFSAIGLIQDIEQLQQLFELFSATLDQLCAIGSAYDQAPQIKL